MDIFDLNYDVERKELIFTEYNTKKFINGRMIYVLGDNYKHNIIWGREFNIRWIIIKNNNFCMEAAKKLWNCLWTVSWYISLMRHIRNENVCEHEYTPYDTNKLFQLFHVRHKRNIDIIGTEQTFWGFIYNAVQLQLFWCAFKCMNMKNHHIR